ncbi:hypothetical protein [Photorhabdus hindustanensis]
MPIFESYFNNKIEVDKYWYQINGNEAVI